MARMVVRLQPKYGRSAVTAFPSKVDLSRRSASPSKVGLSCVLGTVGELKALRSTRGKYFVATPPGELTRPMASTRRVEEDAQVTRTLQTRTVTAVG